MRRRSLSGAIAGIALAVLAALAVGGCGAGGPVPTPYTVSYPAATAGADPLPISLVDQTGLVSTITPAPGAEANDDVAAIAGETTALRVSWTGGPCDDRATLVLNDLGGDRYELAIHNHPPITAGFTCDASAVVRTVDILFTTHLEPTQLSLNVQYP